MRLSVIAVVAFALLVVFALYAVVSTQGMPLQKKSTVIDASYAIQGNYGYVAALRPNTLYNTTVLTMGDGSLFLSITKSVNVTITGTVLLSQPGTVSLSSAYLVTLSGGAWNKTLVSDATPTQVNGSQSAVVSRTFDLNVTQVVKMIGQIQKELSYQPVSYMVQVLPVVTGSAVVAGRTMPIDFAAPLNLTLANGVMTPSGTSHFQQGNATSVVTVTDGQVNVYRELSYVALAASIVLLAGSVFYVTRVEKKPSSPEAVEFEANIRPYAEVIASARSLPHGGREVTLDAWDDLVKVADTLGKPILELYGQQVGVPTYRLFYVLDGDTSYVYEFGVGPAESPGNRARNPGP